MGECICNSCRNLKAVINEEGDPGDYECSYGFPSGECTSCEFDTEDCNCSLSCSHYASDEEAEVPVIINCAGCGRELRQVCDEGKDGEVFCFDCYLKRTHG